jgi:alpha-ketoglutaric semialdehyde dehydrogenase
MTVHQILIQGRWRPAHGTATFRAENPATCEPLPDEYPVSSWQDCDEALDAAVTAWHVLRSLPTAALADFLEDYARRIEARKQELVETAHAETGLPRSPRLADNELPRTTNQLRLAAAAARDGSWAMPTLDTAAGIRSCYASIGPVCVFGPNNFPLAFGSLSGGDFAAAIAAGNPVLGKGHPSHPSTTRLLAEEAEAARQATGLPPGTIQLIYRTSHTDGERLVSDRRVGASGYTGSRQAGVKLKAAADAAGKPIYLELSSINPVVVLPGALRERGEAIATDFTTCCLLGTGQFCTNPGLVLLLRDPATAAFLDVLRAKFSAAPIGTLLSRSVFDSYRRNLGSLLAAGAEILVGGTPGGGRGYSHGNTLLRVTGTQFLAQRATLQSEVFGNCSLLVIADDLAQLAAVLDALEGNLTGCLYSDTAGSDDVAYEQLAPHVRAHVGRLLNDKMPTGVAVSPAMNHGGPFPATGHPGFTAVGIPASLRRFSMLQCYDNVRPHRLPACLQDRNATGRMWRLIDGQWTQADVVR